MFVETIKNRNSPPCTLLRESYREEGKVRHRTIANINSWPDDLVFGLRELLKNHHGDVHENDLYGAMDWLPKR